MRKEIKSKIDANIKAFNKINRLFKKEYEARLIRSDWKSQRAWLSRNMVTAHIFTQLELKDVWRVFDVITDTWKGNDWEDTQADVLRSIIRWNTFENLW